uniref:Dynein regulatory complex subunit 3 n=1 Tax=Anas platyrhynchos platyrhynchos TaxID=8840 RepID=U3IKG8_ANAPP
GKENEGQVQSASPQWLIGIIDNLWQFENLTKLQLDNNIIEKIEALESLVHLVWLDLSFNNIEVIEGLDTLVKLQDLSLYNNRISKIEHMDTLQELQIFSIGKNNLTVVYLRRFKKLRTLNLTGNPFCEEEQYVLFVVAHIPDLVYLDFKRVSDTTRELAVSKYHYLIDPLEHEEAQALAQLEEKLAKQKELEYHKVAFVEYLNGSFLFDSLYAEDTEAAKLAYLPGVDDLLKDFVSVCENLFNYGLKEYEKREAEVSEFYEGLHEVLTANQQEGSKIILDFENQNKEVIFFILLLIHHATTYNIAESKRAEYNEDILQLSETLMTLEIQTADQLEVRFKHIPVKPPIQDARGSFFCCSFSLTVFYTMAQCRDLENRHHEKLLEISINTLEKSVKNELDEDLPDDVRELLVDKTTLVNMVNASHSVHLLKIDMRECDILTNAYRWQASVTGKVRGLHEIDRNRNRVKEIFQYIDNLQEQLDNSLQEQLDSIVLVEPPE